MLLAAVGCTDDSAGKARSDPSPSWPPEVDYHQVIDKIPLQGTKKTRLHWRLPDLDWASEGTRKAVLAARRYRALDYYTYSLDDSTSKADWYAAVAAGDELKQAYQNTRAYGAKGTPNRGVVWLWVDEPMRSGNVVLVRVCTDIGWQADQTKQDKLPWPSGERASVLTYQVRRSETGQVVGQDQYRWKVTRVAGGSPNPKRSRFDRQCPKWADHTPKDQR